MSWDPTFDWWFIGLVALGSATLSTAWIFSSRRLGTWRWRVPVWVLRMLAIGIVVIILGNPIRHETVIRESDDSTVLLLVDSSKSMTLGSPRSRFDEAMDWSKAVAERIPSKRKFRILGFSDDIEWDPEFGADGPSTMLAHALSEVVKGGHGENLRDIIVVSDGQIHDRGALTNALADAQRNGTTISTHVVGRSETVANLHIRACRVERSAPAGARLPVEVETRATGYPDGTIVNLTLRRGDEIIDTRSAALDGGHAEVKFEFEIGIRTESYSVSAEVLPGELDADDNSFEFSIEVADPRIRVLYCEGSTDRITEMAGEMWNSSELIPVALARAGNIDCDTFTTRGGQTVAGRTLTHISHWEDHEIVYNVDRGLPETKEGWFSYDVIIAADVQRANFTDEQLEWTVDLVAERGGGFCMIGGMTAFDVGGWQETIWERLVPVEMEKYGFGHKWVPTRPIFPEAVRSHPILQMDPDPQKSRRILDVHPNLLGLHDIRRAKPGATLLAVREGNDAPLIAVQSYGKGRTMAYLSDPTGGWGVEFQGRWGPALLPGEAISTAPSQDIHAQNEYYNRFWVNCVRWLAENSVRRWRMDLLGRTESVTYRPGDIVNVSAMLPGLLDSEKKQRQSVGARLALDGQPQTTLRYDPDRKEFTGQLKLPDSIPEREVRVIFDAVVNGKSRTDEVSLRVLRVDPEFEETDPDRELLAEIAKIGGGNVLDSLNDTVKFLAQSSADAATETVQIVEPRWSKPWIWVALVSVLAAEWFLRKMVAVAPNRR